MTDASLPGNSTVTHKRTFSEALQLQPAGEIIAFVGGGGKTSLLFALGRELAAAGYGVVATTTTQLAATEVRAAPAYCLLPEGERLPVLLREHRFCVLVGTLGEEKAGGVDVKLPVQLLASSNVSYVLVEADGAKRLPVKAPERHEPAMPHGTTLLVPVVGIDALEGPIAKVAHRPQLVAALTGRAMEEHLTTADVATLLTHPSGSLKHAPPAARVIPFINKVETEAQLAAAEQIAALAVQNPRIQRVLIGAARSEQPLRLVVDKRSTNR